VTRWRWLLFVCGLIVFCVDAREDMQVYDLAVMGQWTAEGLRMVVGHVLREVLVGMTLIAFALDLDAMLPFVLGAALHGLLIRAAFFHGLGHAAAVGWYASFVYFDIAWRLACFEYVWRRRGSFIAELRGGKGEPA
jgi:hypothetical protein